MILPLSRIGRVALALRQPTGDGTMKMFAMAAAMVLAAGAANAEVLRYDLTNPLFDIIVTRYDSNFENPTFVESYVEKERYDFFIEIDTDQLPFDLRDKGVQFDAGANELDRKRPWITAITDATSSIQGYFNLADDYSVTDWNFIWFNDNPDMGFSSYGNDYSIDFDLPDGVLMIEGTSLPGKWTVSGTLPDVSPVPLPASLPLLFGSLGFIAMMRRSRKKQ